MKTSERFIPALGFRWLNRFYDPLIQATLREGKIKSALVEPVGLLPGHRVLDLGAGTGTLTLMLKRAQPKAEVIGVDGDPEILAIARTKATQSGLAVIFDKGMADALPYPDGAFDRVVSSLLLHHLSRETKRRAVREAFRVLKPGGELHIADWGRPHNRLMRVLASSVQWLDGFDRVADNLAGRLPEFFREGGFIDVCETAHYATLYGTLTFYRAKKPQ
jgi:SAM-dependent methyltransferase